MVNLLEKLMTSDEDKRLYAEEGFILDCTERVCELMKQKNISQTELANRMGVKKSNVSRMLDGHRNLTIRTLAHMLFVLDSEARIQVNPLREDKLGPEENQWLTLRPDYTVTINTPGPNRSWLEKKAG